MKRCFVFSAGDFYGFCEKPTEDDYIIAADAGLELCEKTGIKPDAAIGDFDSMDEPVEFKNRIKHPVEKDDTDTMLAIRKGLEEGCTEFHIYGGSGGKRSDHSIANLQSLAFICRHGGRGFMYDRSFVYTVIENSRLEIKNTAENATVSLFALSDRVENVCTEGLYYKAEGFTLTPDFPIGVSNHITGKSAAISCGNGLLLIGVEIV